MDIEEVAANHPEKILSVTVHPAAGLQPFQCKQLAFGIGLGGKQVEQFQAILLGLYRLYIENDASLIEINPLIVTRRGRLLALDAKLDIEANALFRHPKLAALRDPGQEDPMERRASEHDLNYVSLEGNIACMVNGAGLAMATMDLIKLHGGQPANFLDVGGGATAARVTAAFELILGNPNVKAILVNIFGGIVRCDLIADGIINAVQNVGVTIPVVVRLEGTNAEQARAQLAHSGLAIIAGERSHRRRAQGRRGRPHSSRTRQESKTMSILVNQRTKLHLPGLHRQAGHLPFRAVPRLRHAARRRRHARPRRRAAPGPAGIRHRARGGARDRCDRQHDLRAGALCGRLDPRGGRCRHRAGRLHHRGCAGQ